MTFNPAFFHQPDNSSKEYTFDSVDQMRAFASKLKSNPFVVNNDMVNRTTLNISTRDSDSMASIDKIYDTIQGTGE
tara:strand:- start:788 stop:1015 length:228 start_codon:yes stop_codon:yes gene_type:complete